MAEPQPSSSTPPRRNDSATQDSISTKGRAERGGSSSAAAMSSPSSAGHRRGSGAGTTSSSTILAEDGIDAPYRAELARRSVARAALHLGVEGMAGDALDAAGDALLVFLERIGENISASVETSGRPSSHVNVLDALRAVEECTAPAAYQVEFGANDANNVAAGAINGPSSVPKIWGAGDFAADSTINESKRTWEGLAAFLFGPDWTSIPIEGGTVTHSTKGATKSDGAKGAVANGPLSGPASAAAKAPAPSAPGRIPGGKTLLPPRPPSAGPGGKTLVMNSTISGGKQVDPTGGGAGGGSIAAPGQRGAQPSKPGWHAPYLDKVAPFPLLSSRIANPHRLPGHISRSLHSLASDEEACRGGDMVGKGHRHADFEGPKSVGPAAKATTGASSGTKAAARRAEEKAEVEAGRVPDESFLSPNTFWGSISVSGKLEGVSDDGKDAPSELGAADMDAERTGGDVLDRSKRSREGDASPGGDRPKKRIRFDKSATNRKSTGDAERGKKSTLSASSTLGLGGVGTSEQRPAYVPPFFPAFPPIRTYRPPSSTASLAKMRVGGGKRAAQRQLGLPLKNKGSKNQSQSAAQPGVDDVMDDNYGRDAVRRSLVTLGRSVGKSYWGSAWCEDDENHRSQQHNGAPANGGNLRHLSSVTVPTGLSGSVAVSGSQPPARRGNEGPSAQVVPLGRASGSRVSRILEGSMNPP